MAAAPRVRAVVLRDFIDKREKVLRREGEVISVTKRRFEEIMATNDTLIRAADGK